MTRKDATTVHRLRDERGLVMVPVIALIAVALVLGLALLALVDTQTSEARAQRAADAAQTIAEGAAAATANALSTNTQAGDWATTGACRRFTGDLRTASAAATDSLEARITAAVHGRFGGTSDDYDGTLFATTWTVDVCPVAGTGNGQAWDQEAEARWDDAYLARNVTMQPAGRGPARISVWVRSQATVRRVGSTVAPRRRAIATKVRQSTVRFAPPSGFAVGTGSFSTELTSGVNGLASSALLGSVLGTKPIIADNDSGIGVRCGLLSTLNNPSSVCLSGTLAGVSGATNAAGLGTLNTLLGIDRAQTLPTWTMAPTDAQAAYAANATLRIAEAGGTGSVLTKTVGPAPECYTDATTADSIVYIDQVGNGEQYCTITGTAGRNVVKALVIGRGGVRITGPFTGVVYALNLEECGDDGECTPTERTQAPLREVVRIEGNTGKVTGAVWADGAGGSVGIYPSLTSSSTAAPALLGNVCSLPVVGPLLTTLGTTLNGVLTGVLNLLATKQEEVRYPNGTAPSGCSLLTAQLGTLTNSQLLELFATGGSVQVPVSESRTRTCTSYLVVCLNWGPWSAWTTKQTQTLQFPALTADLVGALTSVLTNYTAVQYDEDVVSNAGTDMSVGGGPVLGTYRNVSPL